MEGWDIDAIRGCSRWSSCTRRWGGYFRPTRTRPLIVKLHGDRWISPLNVDDDVDQISQVIAEPVQHLLRDRGVIVVGFGGNDPGICTMLTNVPTDALPHLKQLVLAGARSPGWDFGPNIEQARLHGQPEIDWLPRLASVISDDEEVTTLDDCPAWRDS
jgi:hypothetical protein